MNKRILTSALLFCLLLLMACQPAKQSKEFKLDYNKYELANGLQVVLHEDHSDPMVAVAIQYHVGSNREKPGKTGFAHFFEHMLFQRSEHLPRNTFFNKIDELGGNFNGGTWSDGTIYFEVVPNDALEKILWMESDRMGFFINTITQKGLEREVDVVINEKRQSVDNQPYGHTNGVIRKTLYPSGHPYSWTVIGEMADLRSATVDDVKQFYNQFYAPNNATLVIAGDFKPEEARQWVEKYFGEIKSREKVATPQPQIAKLDKEIRLFHEDKFANMPELTLVYPAPEMFNKDAYALDALSNLLSEGKKAPLYKEIVENTKLAPSVSLYNQSMELAGELTLTVRAFPGKDLNEVYKAIQKAYTDFEANGVNPADLQRFKNMKETEFYGGMASVMGKAFQIASANVFAGTPDQIMKEVEMINAVTPEDVMRVYNMYIKEKPAVITSFVPAGQISLALAESEIAPVTEEKLDSQNNKSQEGAIEDEEVEKTPSTFDRSQEPPLGTLSPIHQPVIWQSSLANGIKVYGIEQSELPLVYFILNISVGSIADPVGKEGLANLTAQLLREGTASQTPEVFEDQIKNLGASLNISTQGTNTLLSGNCLAKNFPALISLVEEMLLQPRWDANELERLRQQNIASLEERKAQPPYIGMDAFKKLIFGDNGFSRPAAGTIESIKSLTMDDIRKFYTDYYAPGASSLMVTGAISSPEVEKATASLSQNWKAKETPQMSLPALAEAPKDGKIFFIDYPDAKQSFIVIGKQAMKRNDPSYYPAIIANYKLGDGAGSDLFRILRLERGYTYGAYSFFNATKDWGVFMAQSSVQTSATKPSIEAFKEIISNYGATYTDKNLETTRNLLLRKECSKYENLYSLVSVLADIVMDELPLDYIKQEEQQLKTITLDEIKSTIDTQINFNDMIYIIVGDAKTQLPLLKSCGLGTPVVLDINGNRIK